MKKFTDFVSESSKFPDHMFLKDHLDAWSHDHDDPKKHEVQAKEHMDKYKKAAETNPQSAEAIKHKAMYHFHSFRKHEGEGKSNSYSWATKHRDDFDRLQRVHNLMHHKKANESVELDETRNPHKVVSDKLKDIGSLKSFSYPTPEERRAQIEKQKELEKKKMKESEDLEEGTHVHSVWIQRNNSKKWEHYTNSPTQKDAEEEKNHLRMTHPKVRILKVHKDKSDFLDNMSHRAAAVQKLNESVELDENKYFTKIEGGTARGKGFMN